MRLLVKYETRQVIVLKWTKNSRACNFGHLGAGSRAPSLLMVRGRPAALAWKRTRAIPLVLGACRRFMEEIKVEQALR